MQQSLNGKNSLEPNQTTTPTTRRRSRRYVDTAEKKAIVTSSGFYSWFLLVLQEGANWNDSVRGFFLDGFELASGTVVVVVVVV